jgi:hypothetical protein
MARIRSLALNIPRRDKTRSNRGRMPLAANPDLGQMFDWFNWIGHTAYIPELDYKRGLNTIWNPYRPLHKHRKGLTCPRYRRIVLALRLAKCLLRLLVRGQLFRIAGRPGP